MQIRRNGRIDDTFASQLKAKLAKAEPDTHELIETKLSDQDREPANAITETDLDKAPESSRKGGDNKPDLTERMLQEAKSKDAPKPATTEQLLNDAPKTGYPHRNEKAWSRTKEKRPVNALPEEMGKASDEAKRERYEKASAAAANEPKRMLDKDIGKQKSDYLKASAQKTEKKAFNLKRKRFASAPCADYLLYKHDGSNAEVAETDLLMEQVMRHAQASGRNLTNVEMAKIAALKARKSELLKVAQQAPPLPEENSLPKMFQAQHGEYNGWIFEYMYPGYFSYSKGEHRIFFTPDHNAKGVIDTQVQTLDGDNNPRYDSVPEMQPVRYTDPITVDQLFAVAKRMADYLDSEVDQPTPFSRNDGGNAASS